MLLPQFTHNLSEVVPGMDWRKMLRSLPSYGARNTSCQLLSMNCKTDELPPASSLSIPANSLPGYDTSDEGGPCLPSGNPAPRLGPTSSRLRLKYLSRLSPRLKYRYTSFTPAPNPLVSERSPAISFNGMGTATKLPSPSSSLNK